MSERTNHFKLGLFVIFSVALLIGGVVVFGSGAFEPEPFMVETYFDTSVTGLEVGAKVLLRGVPQGEVSEVLFVRDAYDLTVGSPEWFKYGSYVVVRLALHSSRRGGRSPAEVEQLLARMVQDGLRVRLATQGLTGIAYLDGDFLDVERYRPFEAIWQPAHFYIPSAPSTFTSIGESLDLLTKKLQAVDFETLFHDVDSLLASVTAAVKDLKVKSFREDLGQVLADSRGMIERIDALLENSDLSETLANASELTRSLSSQLSSGEIRSTLKNVETASGDLPGMMSQLGKTLRRLDRLVSGESSEVAETLANLRLASENLRELTATVKKYPSYVLFGSPPKKARPGSRR